ncbi:MAG TPA: alpha-amylase family glycosyl hydrolase, partial [Methylomirabilota bacterium]|nr:alpha-amylase family glycosyl hydrolase [Methylomirabilota bacterium]
MPSPLLYEINTRCWLHDLGRQQARPITLANVPDPEFETWRRLGFTHLWLMGAWTVGPKSRAHSLETIRRNQDLHPGLQDWKPADITGSPYAVAACKVPDSLGGDAGLAAFRRRLHQHGIQLVLDFVPNHTGLDHPWLRHHPEYFVQSSNPRPGTFPNQSKHARRWIAHGRD